MKIYLKYFLRYIFPMVLFATPVRAQGLRMKRLDKYGNYDLFYDCRHILP